LRCRRTGGPTTTSASAVPACVAGPDVPPSAGAHVPRNIPLRQGARGDAGPVPAGEPAGGDGRPGRVRVVRAQPRPVGGRRGEADGEG
jgi:hypothetical protein